MCLRWFHSWYSCQDSHNQRIGRTNVQYQGVPCTCLFILFVAFSYVFFVYSVIWKNKDQSDQSPVKLMFSKFELKGSWFGHVTTPSPFKQRIVGNTSGFPATNRRRHLPGGIQTKLFTVTSLCDVQMALFHRYR